VRTRAHAGSGHERRSGLAAVDSDMSAQLGGEEEREDERNVRHVDMADEA
jgi:hypothetical protein